VRCPGFDRREPSSFRPALTCEAMGRSIRTSLDPLKSSGEVAHPRCRRYLQEARVEKPVVVQGPHDYWRVGVKFSDGSTRPEYHVFKLLRTGSLRTCRDQPQGRPETDAVQSVHESSGHTECRFELARCFVGQGPKATEMFKRSRNGLQWTDERFEIPISVSTEATRETSQRCFGVAAAKRRKLCNETCRQFSHGELRVVSDGESVANKNPESMSRLVTSLSPNTVRTTSCGLVSLSDHEEDWGRRRHAPRKASASEPRNASACGIGTPGRRISPLCTAKTATSSCR